MVRRIFDFHKPKKLVASASTICNPMKVSITIPTYNREQYICQAIESALQQTMTDIEVIVVDDGSTDNTKEIIRPYMDRIKYVYTENGGPARARNTGMKHAKGEYVSFLDSDDLYYPYKTELQQRLLDRFPNIGMVYTDFSGFDDNGFWDEYHLRNYHTAYRNGKTVYEDIFPEKMTMKDAGLCSGNWLNGNVYMGNIFNPYFQQIVVFTNSMMFRRGILETIGLQDGRYGLFHDLEFALRICKYFKVAFIDVPTYKLRYHSKQISDTTKENGIKIVIEKQRNLLKVIEKHGVEDNKYYSENRDQVNRRMAVAHKFLAIPLMAMPQEAQRARVHLRKCASYGYPEKLFCVASFLPHFFRRTFIKLMSTLKLN